MRLAYGDPPYPGMAHLYRDHPDYRGEVDHVALLERLDTYDGWVLHTASTTLDLVLRAAGEAGVEGFRILAWCKSFASFKPGNYPAYAWEPVLVKQLRTPTLLRGVVSRDFIVERITFGQGLAGAKPRAVVEWALECAGAEPGDELDDLYPGTGAVRAAWEYWRTHRPLELEANNAP